ncbi:NINE protein [Planktothrix sp. FACHB-1355]|uniref:NINE protein n=1 Tax=Aerosakkonema funiforme FACHB-1375 TaxID=2949571 RepID=A0A926VK01_9CYAN|nr:MULTISPECIES: NINE protein [Oscillatoriales]MBD2185221.1 NINE protein [Aerosakkonema funiforme FACHB-1375]MBD3562431.1 NINE protein [Planktothrix sp. FACHB-1355]
MLSKPKSRKVAAILAFSGAVIPVSGLHKFYLGQPVWGILYLVLSWTPIPHVASAIEGFWYLVQDRDQFDRNFNLHTEVAVKSGVDPKQVAAYAEALRQLEQLRQDGLITEYEFEQKRRKLLDQMV